MSFFRLLRQFNDYNGRLLLPSIRLGLPTLPNLSTEVGRQKEVNQPAHPAGAKQTRFRMGRHLFIALKMKRV